MKIGIDARLWKESGVGRYIRNLIISLAIIDRKNEYVLFVKEEDLEEIKKIIPSSWKLVGANIRWHTIKEQLRFPRIIRKENPDIVHFPYFSAPIFYRKPYVVTIHDLIYHHFPTGKASTLPLPIYGFKLLGYKFIISQAAKNAKKIIAVSKTTKNEIIKTLKISAKKIDVVYEAVDDNLKLKKEITEKENYFLYVGNAFPHKNLECLINAFKEFSKTNNSVKLLLVGKDDYFYRRLKKIVKKKKLENSVEFLGNVDDRTLISLTEKALALIQPSLMEGFGLTGLEAMALKCLVLASDISAHREIYEDAAIFFDSNNSEDILNKLRIVSDPDFKGEIYIKKGNKRVLDFSWERTARETLKIYESSNSLRQDK